MHSSPLQDQFLERYEKTAHQNKKRIDFLLNLINEFNRRGIEVLPLKGIDLLLRAYPSSLGLRPMADLDLLIHEKEIPKVRSFLETRGFQRMPEAEALAYFSPDRKILLDISWNFRCLGSVAPLWQRAVSEPIHGASIKLLHPEDALLYFILYVTAHRGKLSPLFVQDLDFFLRRQAQEIDWSQWVRRVIDLRLKVPIHHGLAYAEKKGLKHIPVEVLEALRPSSLPERCLARFYQLMVTEEGRPDVSYAFALLSIPRWRERKEFLRQRIFPSREEVELRYGENPQTPYACFLIQRSFHLFLRALTLLAKDFLLLLTRARRL